VKLKKLISVISSELTFSENKTGVLEYHILAGEKSAVIRFEAGHEWAQSFCPELADGIITALLPYAMLGGYDIKSNIPVSKKLLNGLRAHIIPQLALCTKDAYETKIECPISETSFSPDAVVTAMSLGVDSLTTFLEYSRDCPQEAEKLTHLAFFEAGHSSYADDPQLLFDESLTRTEEFCREYGWELITVRSNIDSILDSLFWKEDFEHIITFRNLCFILTLQKRIKIYYYSASFNLNSFEINLHKDAERYERWMIPLFSTASTAIWLANRAMTRVEKTEYVSTFPGAFRYLTVCFLSSRNCGKCEKCYRTELVLDKLGLLDEYSATFDVDDYRKHKQQYLTDLLSRKSKPLYREVVDMYQGEFSLKNRFFGGIRNIMRTSPLLERVAEKLVRNPVIKKLKNILR